MLQNDICAIYIYLQFRTIAANCNHITGKEISASGISWVEKQIAGSGSCTLGAMHSLRGVLEDIYLKAFVGPSTQAVIRNAQYCLAASASLLHAVAAFRALLSEGRQ